MPKHKFTAKRKGLLAAVAGVSAVAITASVVATAGASESQDAKSPVQKVVKQKVVKTTLSVKTTFSPVRAAAEAQAIAYDTKLVPVSSGVQVKEEVFRGIGTRITLRVSDLIPDRVYGAHVHTKPCGALPTDAGPHYQYKADPTQPSVNPKFANSRNEVWLDLTTDEYGAGRSIATVAWQFRKGGARSVVLHKMATSMHKGHAGTAGARLACINVPFQ